MRKASVLPPDVCHTSNQAEYLAIIKAAEELLELKYWTAVDEATFHTDSQLVAAQVSGRWAVSNPELFDMRKEALERLNDLTANGTTWSIRWVPREENLEADDLLSGIVR